MTGIVHDDVDVAVRVDDLLDRGVDRRLLGDVEVHGAQVDTVLLAVIRRVVDCISVASGGVPDACPHGVAGVGQLSDGQCAEPARRSGNENNHVESPCWFVGSLVVEDLAGGYPIVRDTGLSSRDEAVAQWVALDHYLGEHPWFAVSVSGGEFRTKAAQPIAENCLVQLRGMGLNEDDALRSYRTLWHLMVSSQSMLTLSATSTAREATAWRWLGRLRPCSLAH